ncbi:MAG: ABC transporter ATP-binding protein [Myxococcales bacterium]
MQTWVSPDQRQAPPNSDGGGRSQAPGARLRAEAVSFAYRGLEVLRSVSVDVKPGRVVGVLGPNGSGKTTLIRCLLGVLPPQSGRVLLDEVDIRQVGRRAYALRVAAVPQEMPTDFPLRVGELVLLGRLPHLPAGGLGFETAADHAAAEAALAACGVRALAERSINEISGGELRRVFIARALCQAAPVLLLDEPTGGLDLKHQLAILELLRGQAASGVAVLVVLHDLNLAAAVCDELILLKDGATAASGTPDEVLTAETVAEVYGVRMTTANTGDLPGGRRFLVPAPP